MATLNFNAKEVEPATSFEPLPAGWYYGQIISSEIKPTKNGQGSYLSITIETISSAASPSSTDFVKRQVFDKFNIDNPNPVAVEIAYRQLSALCHAIGVIQVADSQQLHGKPFMFRVAVRPAQTGSDGKSYEATNEVKGYKASDMTRATPVFTPPPVANPINPVAKDSTPSPTNKAETPVGSPVVGSPRAASPVAQATPPWARPA